MRDPMILLENTDVCQLLLLLMIIDISGNTAGLFVQETRRIILCSTILNIHSRSRISVVFLSIRNKNIALPTLSSAIIVRAAHLWHKERKNSSFLGMEELGALVAQPIMRKDEILIKYFQLYQWFSKILWIIFLVKNYRVLRTNLLSLSSYFPRALVQREEGPWHQPQVEEGERGEERGGRGGVG